MKYFFAFVVITFLVINLSAVHSNGNWHVIRTIHIGGKGRWDYLAAYDGKLYVSHDSLVNVVNENSGDSITIIPGTYGVHGIAFAPSFGKGFITAGRMNSVILFDLKTNRVTGSVKTAAGPDAIMYEPFSEKIFVCDGRGEQATIIDPTTNKVTDSISLAGKPEEPASDGMGNIYVNIEDKSEVVHIDAKTFKIVERWKIGNGEAPSGLAIDREHHRLFIACDNKLMIVMNAENGKVIAELPVGENCDGAAYDPSGGFAFCPNGDGTLTVIHEDSPDKFSVVTNVQTKKGARTICLDSKNHHLFLPTAEFGAAPAATTENPNPRPSILPGTFQVLEVGR